MEGGVAVSLGVLGVVEVRAAAGDDDDEAAALCCCCSLGAEEREELDGAARASRTLSPDIVRPGSSAEWGTPPFEA